MALTSITAWILILLRTVLGAGGTWLAALGGSWAYGGTGQGQRYSSLQDITPDTVHRLGLAWTFRAGEPFRPGNPVERTFEVTPLKIGDLTCRGLANFDGSGVASVTPPRAPDGVQPPTCVRHVFLPTIDARLCALNAQSGEPCVGFRRAARPPP